MDKSTISMAILIDMIESTIFIAISDRYARYGVVSHRKVKPPASTAPQEGRVQQPGVLQAALRRRGAAGGGATGDASAEGDGRSRAPGPPGPLETTETSGVGKDLEPSRWRFG